MARSGRTSRSLQAIALGVSLAFVPACLSPHYTVKRSELERLAHAPPDARTTIRAKQRIVFSASPEEADPATMLAEADAAMKAAEIGVKAIAVAQAAAKEADQAATSAAPRDEPPTDEKDERTDEERKKDDDEDDTAALVVVAVIVAGVFIGAGLAVSEGQRFDGQLALRPDQPIHLRNDEGEIGWVPARALTPSMLTRVTEGVVSEDDAALVRLRRAPLDRRGFTYGVEVGAAGMNTLGRELRVGLAGRMNVGFFPTQGFGALIGCALQTGPKGDQPNAIDVRPHLELQAFPLGLRGALHPGAYVEGGRSFGSERLATGEVESTSSWSAGGGLLLQVDLTTLLALVARAGVVALPDPGPATLWSPQVTVGIAVY